MHKAKLWATQVFTLAKMKGNLQQTCTFIQHHIAVQPLTAIPRPAKPPFAHQTACKDRHCTSKKQPAKADHLSVVYEI